MLVTGCFIRFFLGANPVVLSYILAYSRCSCEKIKNYSESNKYSYVYK